MKTKTLKQVGCLLILSMFVACTKEKPDHQTGSGTLKLSVQKVSGDQLTIHSIRSVPVNEYKVTIFTSADEVYLEYDRYEDIPAEISLESGDYYVKAHSGNDSIAAFENPYFEGSSKVFTIGNGAVSQVDVTCSILNCAVRITYHANVISGFNNYYTVVKCNTDSLVFLKDEVRNGYFQLQPLHIYSVLEYELTNGSTASKIVSGNINAPEAANLYEITVDASSTGLETSIALTLNEQMDTNFLEINDHLNVNQLQEGDLLITEIMYDPANLTDTDGEWFEIYNNTLSPVNIMDLVITGNGDDHIVNEEIVLQPSSYFVLARTDTAFDGTKYIYSGITLLNTTDIITLQTYGSDGTDGTMICTVTYDESGGFPNAAGASLNLSTLHFDVDEAQLSTSWCVSTNVFNTGDNGTPGAENISCD